MNDVTTWCSLVESSRPLQSKNTVADHLGPDSQSAAMHEPAQGCVGDRADPELQRRAVRHEVRYVFANLVFWPVGGVSLGRVERLVHLDADVDHVRRDLTLAEGVGHLTVDLCDDERSAGTCHFEGRGQDIDLDTERNLAVPRCRGVDEDDVWLTGDREEPRHQRKSHRYVVEQGRMAHPGPYERRLVTHTRTGRDGMAGAQHEDPVALEVRIQDFECLLGRGPVAGHDNSWRCPGERTELVPELLL